jgi:hypothetical protein
MLSTTYPLHSWHLLPTKVTIQRQQARRAAPGSWRLNRLAYGRSCAQLSLHHASHVGRKDPTVSDNPRIPDDVGFEHIAQHSAPAIHVARPPSPIIHASHSIQHFQHKLHSPQHSEHTEHKGSGRLRVEFRPISCHSSPNPNFIGTF